MDHQSVLSIAKLARMTIDQDECAHFAKSLSDILERMEALDAVNTDQVEPMHHAMDIHQRLEEDVIREKNERDLFQSIAPQDQEGKRTVVAGLYLVPKVID